ncbi:MAG: 30S ribosomal protein S20 [Gammaproteobacteria bacterium]|nr:30S ribosomal protein S20 [Gammaproteobacteria bacterium]
MANTKQAKKRVRQSVRRRQRTMTLRSMMRTSLKKVVAAITAKELTKAQEAYTAATKMVDKMVTKGIIHKNKAARHKSRLNEQLKQLSAA